MISKLNVSLDNSYPPKESAVPYSSKKIGKTKTTPGLHQGDKFKHYQNKITNNLVKKIKTSAKEGFETVGLMNSYGLMDDEMFKQDPDELYQQSKDVLAKTDISSGKGSYQQLKQEYANTLIEYEKLLGKLSGDTSNYILRTSADNPYLNSVIQFSNGQMFYVTNQGVAKPVSSDVFGINPYIPKTVQNLDYKITNVGEGSMLPTTPSLLVGTPLGAYEMVGNEGLNLYVSNTLNNPSSKYLQCYNDQIPKKPQKALIPQMGPSNSVGGINAGASSVYANNNDFTGPWRAFDNDVNTWWHSNEGDSNYAYDYTSGQYKGITNISFNTPNGSINVRGEWITLQFPTPKVFTGYQIQGRQGCCGDPNGRDPNTWYIIGYNGNTWEQIDYQENQSFNWQAKTFSVNSEKPYTQFLMITTVVGDPNAPAIRDCLQIATLQIFGDDVSNQENDANSAMPTKYLGSKYVTLDKCQQYAADNGYKYFGLQDIKSDGTAKCAVTNDITRTMMYGISTKTDVEPLWKSNSSGATTAQMTDKGNLVLLGSDGSIIFRTNNDDASCANAIINSVTATYGAVCNNEGYHVAIGNATQKVNETLNNSSNKTQLSIPVNNGFFGDPAVGCGKGWDTSYKCGNTDKTGHIDYAEGQTYIYDCSKESSGCKFTLNLQDDGNMCIYKAGQQYAVYCTMTNGQQKQPNPEWAAANGKYGVSSITTGQTLHVGEWIGSNDGSLKLILESDGSLVLYTSTTRPGCKKSDNGIMGGENWVNAVYQMNAVGKPSEISKVSYVDADSKKYGYPDSDIGLKNTYTYLQGWDSAGYDIPGAGMSGTTPEKCQEKCNTMNDCYGFAFTTGDTCWPKTKDMYPKGIRQQQPYEVDLYVRDRNIISTPIGVRSDMVNVDSVTYDKYTNSGRQIENAYGLINLTKREREELYYWRERLNQISQQIVNLTGQFNENEILVETQSRRDVSGLGNYLTNLADNDKKINTISNSLSNYNISDESNIAVLQENYNYLFWSILAVSTVLVAINISR